MEQSKLARAFKALSNEQRLKLFEMIYREGGVPADDRPDDCCGMDRAFTRATRVLNLSRSTISHHFKELQSAGLITCERNGQSVICTVNPEMVALLRDFMN